MYRLKLGNQARFLFYVLIFIQIPVVAQISVTGKVVDEANNEPLMGAQIVLDNGSGAITDRNGLFSIDLKSGTYSGTVNFLGYEKKEITINTQNPDLGTITLQLSSTTLDEVIVSASPKSFKDEFKGSNFRITPITLKNSNPLSTEEMLRNVPG